MKTWKWTFAALAALGLTVASSPPASAYKLSDKLDITGQLRSRFERNDGRDGDSSNDPKENITNRVRLGVRWTPTPEVGAFVQLQDVRVWGEEDDTLKDWMANGFDVHQAYGELHLLDGAFHARIGRQEIKLFDERLVGAVGWTPQARSFDGVTLGYDLSNGLYVHALYAMLHEEDTINGQTPGTDGHFAGLVAGWKFGGDKQHLALIGLFDTDQKSDRKRFTVGLRDQAHYGMVKFRIEGYYQGGSMGSADYAAFMASGAVGIHLKDAMGFQAWLWGDYLSGDDNPTDNKIKAFDTLFATNHAFYGWADFFLNVPKDTGNRGLIDVAAKFRLAPHKRLKLLLDIHHFRAANTDGLNEAMLGNEVDFALKWKPLAHFDTFFGAFVMLPSDGLVEVDRVSGTDPDIGIYLHTNFTF